MSKQPQIQLPISGGYWQISAHLPSPGAPKYSANLHLGSEIVCNVFCHYDAELTSDSLVLDCSYIALKTLENFKLAAAFLASTAAYTKGEAA